MVLSSVAILIEFVVFDIKKNKWKNFQGSKGIRQWPINVSTSPMMMYKKLVVETFEHST